MHFELNSLFNIKNIIEKFVLIMSSHPGAFFIELKVSGEE
jgi:hypothetical protein